MKVVALVSGGKDSCYNMIKCIEDGHEIVALANLYPEGRDELDSFMYQTVGHEAIEYYAEAVGIPLFRRGIKGKPLNQDMEYQENEGDEVEDLLLLLKEIKDSGVDFSGISVGAIHSNYQRIRAESVCSRLGLKMLCYLWGRNQEQLLQEMIDHGLSAVLVKVAVIGLDKTHLGMNLKQVQPTLLKLKEKFGINVCGEGGEFETLTTDCCLFKKRLVIKQREVICHSNDAFAPVSYLKPLEIVLEDKQV